MPSQGVWGRVRERLRRFPALLASCEEQASVYGKCVASKTTGHADLKKDVCAKEFQMLMECFTKAQKPQFLPAHLKQINSAQLQMLRIQNQLPNFTQMTEELEEQMGEL